MRWNLPFHYVVGCDTTNNSTLHGTLSTDWIGRRQIDVRRLFEKCDFQVELFGNTLRWRMWISWPNNVADVKLLSGPRLPYANLSGKREMPESVDRTHVCGSQCVCNEPLPRPDSYYFHWGVNSWFSVRHFLNRRPQWTQCSVCSNPFPAKHFSNADKNCENKIQF